MSERVDFGLLVGGATSQEPGGADADIRVVKEIKHGGGDPVVLDYPALRRFGASLAAQPATCRPSLAITTRLMEFTKANLVNGRSTVDSFDLVRALSGVRPSAPLRGKRTISANMTHGNTCYLIYGQEDTLVHAFASMGSSHYLSVIEGLLAVTRIDQLTLLFGAKAVRTIA